MSVNAAATFPWTVVEAPEPGEMRSGYLTWDEPIFAGREWPWFALRGVEPGPAVAIDAAIHGVEYPGVLGAIDLARSIDPAKLRGSLLVLPVVNLSAFRERAAYITPEDGLNLNRTFPGKANGTYSERLALQITQEIIAPADVVIDLHGGDAPEAMASHAGTYRSGDPDRDALLRRLIESFAAPYSVSSPPPAPDGATLTAAAYHRGKLTLYTEIGANGMVRPGEAELVAGGLRAVLACLDMVDGQSGGAGSTRWVETAGQAVASAGGLWRSDVVLEQEVRAGDRLGTLTDLLGNEIAFPRAEVDGTVLYHMAAAAVRAGDLLVMLVRDVANEE